MTVLFFPSNGQWVGAARETVYGTPAAAPTFWIPVDMSSIAYTPGINPLTDNYSRGLMSGEYQQVAGKRKDTLSYKTFAYLDSAYLHFLAAFGRPDAVTGTAVPYTHKSSVENGVSNAAAQPQSWTLFYTDAAGKCWQVPGCMISSVKLTVKTDELITIEPSWMGMPAVQITPPTNTPPTSAPFPSWNASITLAGAADLRRTEIVLEYKRDTGEIPTINGSQSPLAIMAATMTGTATLTGVYQGTTDVDLVDYLANTQPALTVKIAPVGDAVHYLLLQHSLVAYDSAAPKGQSKWMEISSALKLLANPTDALDSLQSLGQVQLVTAVSAAL